MRKKLSFECNLWLDMLNRPHVKINNIITSVWINGAGLDCCSAGCWPYFWLASVDNKMIAPPLTSALCNPCKAHQNPGLTIIYTYWLPAEWPPNLWNMMSTSQSSWHSMMSPDLSTRTCSTLQTRGVISSLLHLVYTVWRPPTRFFRNISNAWGRQSIVRPWQENKNMILLRNWI